MPTLDFFLSVFAQLLEQSAHRSFKHAPVLTPRLILCSVSWSLADYPALQVASSSSGSDLVFLLQVVICYGLFMVLLVAVAHP